MKTRLLMIFAFSILMISIPNAFAAEYFHGKSSFENIPSEISRHFPSIFEIKMQYAVGPWGLDELVPIIEIFPENAASHVNLDFEPASVYKNSIARIPVTITVDPDIDYDKIFLNVSFEGNTIQNTFKSGWTDSLILSIGSRDEIGTFVNYEIILWDDFEHEIIGKGAIFKNDLPGLAILETGTPYFVVVKAEFTESSFGDKPTAVDATVGYAIKKGDHIPRPPMHENATDEDHMEFSMKQQKLIEEFPKQSAIEDSYDFVVDVENPFFIKFPLTIEEPGQYTRQFYRTTHIFEGPDGSAMGGLVVVEKFSKAVDENSSCINEDFRRLIKHDYSKVVCVDGQTAWKLIDRGWGL